MTIGRPGRAVAAIRRTPAGRLLVPVEGGPATVNGVVAPAEGLPVAAGDRIEIGGVALEIVAPERSRRLTRSVTSPPAAADARQAARGAGGAGDRSSPCPGAGRSTKT